jgi:hypothetical protein
MQISRGSPYHRDRVRKSPIPYQRQLNLSPACKWDELAQIKEYKLCYTRKYGLRWDGSVSIRRIMQVDISS